MLIQKGIPDCHTNHTTGAVRTRRLPKVPRASSGETFLLLVTGMVVSESVAMVPPYGQYVTVGKNSFKSSPHSPSSFNMSVGHSQIFLLNNYSVTNSGNESLQLSSSGTQNPIGKLPFLKFY